MVLWRDEVAECRRLSSVLRSVLRLAPFYSLQEGTKCMYVYVTSEQAPPNCNLVMDFSIKNSSCLLHWPHWELLRAPGSKASWLLLSSVTTALGFVLFQFAAFWKLPRGAQSPFIIIVHFVIYTKKRLGVNSCRLTFIMLAIECINIFKSCI